MRWCITMVATALCAHLAAAQETPSDHAVSFGFQFGVDASHDHASGGNPIVAEALLRFRLSSPRLFVRTDASYHYFPAPHCGPGVLCSAGGLVAVSAGLGIRFISDERRGSLYLLAGGGIGATDGTQPTQVGVQTAIGVEGGRDNGIIPFAEVRLLRLAGGLTTFGAGVRF